MCRGQCGGGSGGRGEGGFYYIKGTAGGRMIREEEWEVVRGLKVGSIGGQGPRGASG